MLKKRFCHSSYQCHLILNCCCCFRSCQNNKAPIILQTSQGGAAYFAGKGVDNKDQAASIAGSIAAAHYIRAIAPTYGIPVVYTDDHCVKIIAMV